jgi:hypothetical protein
MKNYQFHIEQGEQTRVLAILKQFNDILIDRVTSDAISFTIELEDHEADALYDELRMEVELRVFAERGQFH